jgi:signal transduction histidine kinase
MTDAAQDTAALRELLAARDAEIALLASELEETNRGVVALYAELDDRAVQLREASELKSRFLWYMSHEFRTPLGSILSIARILLDRLDGPLTVEQLRQVEFIRGSARELSEMVEDLLDLAKVEAGRVTISPAWFDLVDIFSALRGMFKPILDSESVTLNMEDPRDVPRVFTDDKKLSQILRNFVSNALKFTTEGEVRVTAVRDGDDVVFSVVDTGVGIAPDHLSALFQDFVQLDSPIQKRLRGTGLGLALSRKLALLLGGNVGVTSELGKGSTFWVRIPIDYTGRGPLDAAAPEPAP